MENIQQLVVGVGRLGGGGIGKKEKGPMDNSEVITGGGGIRGLNGKEKIYNKDYIF